MRLARVRSGSGRLALGTAALGAGLVAVATAPRWWPDRWQPPRAEELLASHWIAQARSAGAATWAPELLHQAEFAWRASLSERRRQDVRWLPWRDYRPAASGFARARAAAERAAELAPRRRAAARRSAGGEIERAGRALEDAQRAGRTAGLDAPGLEHLAAAQSALTEGRHWFAAGQFALARAAAARSVREAAGAWRSAVALASRFTDPAALAEWRRWLAESVALSRQTAGTAVVVNKDRGQLTIYRDGQPYRSYPVELGRNPAVAKLMAGDGATPEGRYRVVQKRGPGETAYHKALVLDYPNPHDRVRFETARREGRVSAGARLGGLIEIHGRGGRGYDWTDGCVALANQDMDDLFALVGVGTPVTILGGDGSAGRFSSLARSPVPEWVQAARSEALAR